MLSRVEATLPFENAVSPSISVIASPPRRVLLVKLSSLGDVVHALPLAESLRAGLGPEAFLGWVVQSKFAPLLDGNPHLSAIYELQSKSARPILQTGELLRAQGFEVVLDAQGLLVSGLMTWLSRARLRIGLDKNREGNRFFLTHPVVAARQREHIVSKLLGFCDALGLPRVAPRPQTYLANGEAEAASTLLEKAQSSGGPIVGCIIGASTPDKAWPVERWMELSQTLAGTGARIVLLGGTTETETARQILGQSRGDFVFDLTGQTTPRVLASVLARCAAVVGGDSGPTHLAVAVGTPVVGLYGVTDPLQTGPDWGPSPAVVLDFAEADAPAHLRRPRHATLPDAMARIPASAAVQAVQTLLRSVPTKT